LAEVAEQCGCSLASVKRYIGRAEQRVQEELSWEWAGGDVHNWRQVDAG
jgi:DNA-directed RNA polymerase specialized sigma24 family protein